MMSDSASTRYVYEPRRLRINESLIAAMLCGTPGVILAIAAGYPWNIPILATTVAVGVLAIRRAFRLSLEASRDRVIVRNFWRTYEFDWLDVAKIGLGEETMGVLPQPAVAFGLRNGRVVRAQATPFRDKHQTAIFDALRTLAPPSVQFFVPMNGKQRSTVEDP